MPRIAGNGVSTNGNNYLFVDYSIGTQDVANNRTEIAWTLGFHYGSAHMRVDNPDCSWGATGGTAGTASGGTGGTGWPAPGGTFTDIGFVSGSFWAYHDSAGNCWVTVGGDATGDFPSAWTSTISSGFGLPQIPRQPTEPGAPSVSGHTDSNPTTATISWTAPSNVGAGLVDRQIQISTNSGFSTTHTDSTASWGTSYNATGLAKATLYYTRVRASSSAGWGPWSSTTSFTTGTTAPGQPSVPWTGTITYTTINVNWNAPSDNGGTPITNYTVERATNSSFTTGVVSYSAGTATTYTITGLTATTAYWVRVRATNAAGTSANSVSLATGTQTATAPSPPTLVNITNVTGTTLDVDWRFAQANGSPITSYILEYSLSAGFSSYTTISGITEEEAQVTGLGYGDTYYFRVKAVNALGTSAPSDVEAATMGSTTPFAPAAPSIGSITQITATVTYAAPSEDGGSAITGYDIQRATDSGFTTDVVTTPDTASPLAITGLIPATTYYVRVRAKNANGNGAWSPSTTFVALASFWTRSGGAFVGAQVYLPNGSGWVLATTQKWSGSAWV